MEDDCLINEVVIESDYESGSDMEQDESLRKDKQVQTSPSLLQDYLDENYSNSYLPTEDLNLCSICTKPWAPETDHRVVALKCGHLFGERCIRKWLSEDKSKGGARCPNCNQIVKKTEVRVIYAKTIFTFDESEVTAAKEAVTKEQEKIKALTIERGITETNLVFLYDQLKDLQARKRDLKRLVDHMTAKKQSSFDNTTFIAAEELKSHGGKFHPVACTELMIKGDCRVLATSEKNCIIVCTQRSNIPLFEGYGLRDIGPVDMKPKKFIPLHKAQIKDVCFHPEDPVVLTASLDKTLKITNILTTATIETLNLDDGAWSCCWNKIDPKYFYVGLKNGKVFEYDVRFCQYPANEMPATDKLPVCSLQFVQNNDVEGIVATRLRNCDFYLKRIARYEPFSLPVVGNFMSSHYNNESSNLLLSSRPLRGQSNLTHSIYQLTLNPDAVDQGDVLGCLPIKKLTGGTRADQVLRSKIFPHPSEESSSLICAGDQDTGGFLVWDTNSGDPVQKVEGLSPVFDLSLLRVSDSNPNLIALTENKIYFYKWSL